VVLSVKEIERTAGDYTTSEISQMTQRTGIFLYIRIFLFFSIVFFDNFGRELHAAEVKNLAVTQQGNRVVVRYDLVGKLGEKEADVTAAAEIDGERYPAERLTLSGDVGKKVKIGKGKSFIWDGMKDFPAGFEGEVTWDVEASGAPVAVPTAAPVVASGSGFTDPTLGMPFVKIKGGCYDMGDTFGDGDKDEKPVHEVCVGDFNLAKYTVTVGEFRKFTSASGYKTEAEKASGCAVWNGTTWEYDASKNWKNPGFDQNDRHPVVCVSWNDSQAFVNWLSGESGKNYRLPTEAEWEFAARSGGKKEKFAGTSDANSLYRYANFCDKNCEFSWKTAGQDDGHRYTAPVGSHLANDLGLYDMTGNVWQWLNDWYGETYYQDSLRSNPKGPSSGEYRVLRGGSWGGNPRYTRAANRFWGNPVIRDGSYGFRLVLPQN